MAVETAPPPDAFAEVLAERLEAAVNAVVVRHELVLTAPVGKTPAERAGELLAQLVGWARLADDIAWLTLAVVLGRLPSTNEVDEFRWDVASETPESATTKMLQRAWRSGSRTTRPLEVVTNAVVVEVDFCARYDTHTGIMRVVRETVPRWVAKHRALLVAWAAGPVMRTLSNPETSRVLSYGTHTPAKADAPTADPGSPLVVPYGTTVLFPDVAVYSQADAVSALARYSGNVVSWIGYDLIPILSADLRPSVEVGNPAVTFTAIKYSTRVAGISQSAATEYAGFVDALPAQGIRGPIVRGVPLPSVGAALPPGPHANRDKSRPTLLIVGSREKQKNVRAAFHAAEVLWAEGLDFELRHLGPGGWDDSAFAAVAARMEALKRPFTALGRVSEQRLWDEMRAADAVLFFSLHEGYGLPVAEALSVGTPVVTTNYGSQAEIAADGGCILVDPRDDESIAAALRSVITDRDRRESLVAAAAVRPTRTWDDYAAETWAFLVNGVEPFAAQTKGQEVTR